MLSPVDLLGKTRQEAYDEGMKMLRMVGQAEKALSYPGELSGGQKQRIAIARALAMDQEVLLTEAAQLDLHCGGPDLNHILSSVDQLSLSVLRGITADIRYSSNSESELHNQLRLMIQPEYANSR